jgi:hypothetical protein
MNIRRWKHKMHGISRAGLIMLALSTSGGAWADQQLTKQGEETFKINLGGILNQNDTSLRLDGSSGQSREINLEDAGLKRDSTSLLGEARGVSPPSTAWVSRRSLYSEAAPRQPPRTYSWATTLCPPAPFCRREQDPIFDSELSILIYQERSSRTGWAGRDVRCAFQVQFQRDQSGN